MGFEKALRAVKVIKDQIQYRSQSLLNLARGYLKVTTGQKGSEFLFTLTLGSYYRRTEDLIPETEYGAPMSIYHSLHNTKKPRGALPYWVILGMFGQNG